MKDKSIKKIGSTIVVLLMMFFGIGNISEGNLDFLPSSTEETTDIHQGEAYNSLQEVVDYLDLYDELPPNYLTKKEAQKLGWNSSEGNLWEVAPNMSIGGDYFGNFEGLLPEKESRDYQEADIGYEGGYRGPERLVFSNDGLYFYTDDHYQSFEEIQPGGDVK